MPRAKEAKPGYLDLLNAICLAEGRAGIFLKSWAGKTPDPGLKACLSLVAARETSHRNIFKRRIHELGYTVQQKDDPSFQERLQVLGSDIPDIVKLRWQQTRQQQQPQRPTLREGYEAAMSDETVDPLTRSLLRWFADEEDDSRAVLREAYAGVEARG